MFQQLFRNSKRGRARQGKSTDRRLGSLGRRSFRSWLVKPWIELLENRTLLTAVSWVGGSGDWGVASNWSTGQLPGPGDDVTIDRPGITVTHSAGTDAIHSLTSTDALILSGGSLTLAGGTSQISNAFTVNNTGSLVLNSATLNGTGTLTNAASLSVTGGTVGAPLTNRGTLLVQPGTTTFAGAFANAAGATLRVQADYNRASATLTVTAAGGFANDGLIDLTMINGDYGGIGATLNATGTLVNRGALQSSAGSGGFRTLAAPLNNQGTVTVNRSLTLAQPGAAHANSGTMNLAGGDLTVNQSGTNPSFTTSGTLTIGSGHTLAVNGGTFSYTAGTLSGAGTLAWTSTTVNLGANLANSVAILNLSSTTVNGTSTLTNATGMTLNLVNSTINAPVTNQGTLVVLTGTSTFGGAFGNAAGATLRVQADNNQGSASAAFPAAAGLANDGLIDLTMVNGSYPGYGATLSATGMLVNRGTLQASAGTGGFRTLAAPLTNQGTLTVNQPLTLGQTGAAHANSGTITLSGGDLTVNQSAAGSFSNSGTITLATGRTLVINGGGFTPSTGTVTGTVQFNGVTFGSGTLSANLTGLLQGGGEASGANLVNQGTLLVLPGTSTFAGAFSNAAGATLRVQADNNQGSATAAFTAAGGLSNDGLIDLTMVNGGYPGYGATLSATGTLVNRGTLQSSAGSGGFRTLAAPLNNQGTVTVNQPLTLGQPGAAHANSGTITLAGGDLTVNQSGTGASFTTSGTITAAGGHTLTINGGTWTYTGGTLSGAGTLAWTNATATLSADLANTPAVLNLSGTTVNGPGALTIAAGNALNAVSSVVNVSLTNQGTLLVLPGSSTFGGAFSNAAGATLRVQADNNQGSATAAFTAAAGLSNDGLIDLTMVNGGYPGYGATLSATGTLVNRGTLQSSAGSGGFRTVSAPIDNRGSLIVNQPLTVDKAGAVHANSGTVNLAGGNLTVNQSAAGALTNSGTITLGTGRTLTLNGGRFNPATGTVTGTVQFNGVTFGSGTLSSSLTSLLQGGGEAADANLVNRGTLVVLAGASTFAGTFSNAAGATLRVQADNGQGSATAAFTAAGGLSNDGLIDLTMVNGGYPGYGATLSATGTLLNRGSLQASAGSGGFRALTAPLNNQGALTVNQPLTLDKAGAAHANSGTITLAGGDLTINQSGTSPSFTNSGTITVAATHTLTVSNGQLNLGAGTVTGTARWNGVTLGSGTVSSGLTAYLNNCSEAASANLVNQGTLVVLPGNSTFAGTFSNALGATLRVQADNNQGSATAAFTAAGGLANDGLIDLTMVNGGYPGYGATLSAAGTLTNRGILQSSAGSGGFRTLAAPLSNQGTLTINSALTLGASAAAHVNSGTITVTGGDLTVNQSGAGASFTNNGTITVASGHSFTVNGGQVNPGPGTVTGTAQWNGVTLGSGTISSGLTAYLSNGTEAANADLVNQGTLVVLAGTSTFVGTFSNAPGATLRVQADNGQGSASAAFPAAAGLANDGLIDLTMVNGSYPGYGATLSATGMLVNRGTLQASAGTGGFRSINAQLDNQGMLLVAAPTTINQAGAAHRNEGTITVNGGGLTVNQSGANPSFTNAGAIDVEAGTFAITAGGLALGSSAVLVSQPTAVISLSGNLTGITQNANRFNLRGTLFLNGPGSSSAPQSLEVQSQDLGNTSQAFVNNFAIGTLQLANNVYARFTSSAMPALAFYANAVLVPSGATLDLNLLHTYARQVQNSGTINGTVNPVLPGPLALGNLTVGALPNDTQVDEWTFYGRQGQGASVIVNTGALGSPPPLQPYVHFASVKIINPDGSFTSASNQQDGADVSLLGVALPADGTYRVQVRAQAGNRGNYGLTVWSASVNNTALTMNQVLTGQLTAPFQVDHWNFTAAAGFQVQFDLINASNGGFQFDLAGPSYSRSQLHNGDLLTLPAAGNYVLSVSSPSQQTGAYAFRVRPTTQISLVLGQPYTGALTGSGQALVFKATVPDTKPLLVDLRDANAADHNEVYVQFGSPPTRADYQYRFSTPASANQRVLVPAAAPGNWYILVYGDSVPAPSTITLTATASTVFLTGSTPDHAGNAADATLTLTGSGFDASTTVSLIASGGTAYPASTASIDLPTQITATFRAGTVPPGSYTVRVSRGTDHADLSGAFQVVAGGRAVLETNLIVPGVLGRHATGTLTLQYANTGDIAMPAPLLELMGSDKALLTLDQSKVVQGLWTSAKPDGLSDTIYLLASGATPGVLQPGERISVPVYYSGLLQPWDFSHTTVTFNVTSITSTDARPIDWSSLKAGLRPSLISPAAWDAIFANLVALTGTTWGDYVTMLDNNAGYLGRLGEKVTDVSQLWNFQVQQAIGFSPIMNLGDAVDEQVVQPGFNVSFGRFFNPSLVGRYQLGVLGWGWTWSGGWQQTLTVASDGSVTVADTDGSQRRFQPDLRGGYFAQAGDMGMLSFDGQTYTLQEANGQRTHFRADGRVDYLADPNGNRITAGYTGSQLTSLTHSAGQALQIHYNAAGRIDRVTDSAGRSTVYGYDPTNQYLTSVQTPDGLVTRYTYDQGTDPLKTHALLSIEHPGSVHDYFTYDGHGRLNSMSKDGNAEPVTFAYSLGTVAATDAAMNTTQYFFDYRGLEVEEVDPLQHATHFGYDGALNLTRVTDPAGQSYTYQYDVHGNLTRSTNPLNATTSFVYAGPYNRVTAVTDALGNQTQYGYDARGNLTSITYADGSREQYSPDAAGDPTQWTNRRGQPIAYQRDSAGRVRRVTYPDGSHVDYNYDPVSGDLLSASDATGTTTLSYGDPQHPDWVTRVTYPDGRYLAYQYDPAGRRSQMTDQAGFTVKYHYDAVGRLDMLLDGNDRVIAAYTYNATGKLQRQDNGNGTYTTYDYTATGQIKTLINYAPDGTINSRFDYTYNPLGQVATMTTLQGRWTYGYDAIGELTSVQLPSGRTIQYQYDANGNRTAVTDNGVTTTYTTNRLDEYVTVGSVVYGYDADGNLISKQDGNSLTTYTYDAQNRLIKVVSPQGTWTYTYDVFGNRRTTSFNGQTTTYLLDPAGLGDVVGAYDGAGNLIADYTYGLGLTSTVAANGTADYYDFDASGSTVGLSGPSGRYVNSYSYLPFGETLSATQTVANPFGFAGQVGSMTDGNGLAFMRARYYAAPVGAFLSTDPLGAAGRAPYKYALNNPVQLVDPSGWDSSPAHNFAQDLCNYTQALNEAANSDNVDPNAIAAANAAGQQAQQDAPKFDGQLLNLVGGTEVTKPGLGTFKTTGQIAKGLISGGQSCLNNNRNPNAAPPGSPPGAQGPGGTSQTVNSQDPNDKTGPAGYGAAHFVTLNQAVPYRIDFENDAHATAPAQRVDITDQLSADLDWSTFAITEVGFGDTLLNVPAGSQHFQTAVAMTYNGHTFQVQVEVGLHAQTGVVFATFQSIDPATNLPPDVLTGFLPPENGTGRGQGHVAYTVHPKAGLSTGTQIRNIALVTFDFGETIATDQVDPHDPTKGTDPTKEALITLDAVPPASSVQSLPAITTTPSFLVQWSGQDDTGGSGLAYYDVDVSDNGSPYTAWLQRTTLTQATFTGRDGHTYAFYSVATDNAGNREPTPTQAQATTTLYTAAVLSVVPNGPVTAGTPFTVTVTARDVNNNIASAYTGTVHFTSSDSAGTLPADYTFTLADMGVHTFTVTLRTAGSASVTATDTATPTITGTATVTVAPAAASTFVVSGFPALVTAGTATPVTVTALDPYGNVATGYTGTVTFTSTDPAAALPADYAFTAGDNGMHTFAGIVLVTAGRQTVTATDTGNAALTGSAAVPVAPAAADHFAVTTSAADPQVAGTPFDVTVTVQDVYGNAVRRYTGTVHFSSADPYGATLPPDYTFQPSDHGVVTFPAGATLYTAGTWDITATDTATGITGSASVNVVAAPAVAFRIVAPAAVAPATPFDVTVLAVDPYGNVDPTYTGTITWTTTDGDPGVVLPPAYTFQSSDQGRVTFAGGVTLITPGDQVLTVSDPVNGFIGSATVTVSDGTPPTFRGEPFAATAPLPGAVPVPVRQGQPEATRFVDPAPPNVPIGLTDSAAVDWVFAHPEARPFDPTLDLDWLTQRDGALVE